MRREKHHLARGIAEGARRRVRRVMAVARIVRRGEHHLRGPDHRQREERRLARPRIEGKQRRAEAEDRPESFHASESLAGLNGRSSPG
jgi:hypothetical protein